jgi:hypothetical protein
VGRSWFNRAETSNLNGLGSVIAVRTELEHFDAGDMEQGTNDDVIGIRIAYDQTSGRQDSATGVAHRMNNAAGKPHGKRLERTSIEQCLEILAIHEIHCNSE